MRPKHANIVSSIPNNNASSFEVYWNRERLRRLAWIIAGITALSLPLAAASSTATRIVALLWMCGLFVATLAVIRRINTDTPILVINHQGIIDSRLNHDPIYWSDIDAVAPCDPHHSRVLELYLKWPEYRLAKARPLIRLGGALQRRVGVPALTLSLLFLDCELIAVCDAIATFRPGLLPSQLIHHD
ncbi:MAG: hypothetical protein ABL898_01635 [Hyphomicrobiaceae bacterium]|nr:hypothetical protein [Hyphomicrobiaceae bacterium]